MEFTEAFERSLRNNQNLLVDNEFENIITTIKEANDDINFNMEILDELMSVQAEYEQLTESAGSLPPIEPRSKSGGENERRQNDQKDNAYDDII